MVEHFTTLARLGEQECISKEREQHKQTHSWVKILGVFSKGRNKRKKGPREDGRGINIGCWFRESCGSFSAIISSINLSCRPWVDNSLSKQ